MRAALPQDPTQLQVMLQVARSVAQQGSGATAEHVHKSTSQTLELLDLDPGRARQALTLLRGWETSPAREADRFLGELALKAGLDKVSLTENAVLAALGRVGRQLGAAKAGFPEGVKLPPGEASGVWDGQHPRLAADFPKIVLGDKEPGTVTLDELVPKDARFKVTDALKKKIAQGVNPREHLHPGGIVGSELVAQLAELKEGDRIADLCSGEGGVARYFAETRGVHVDCYEVSDAASAVALRKKDESPARDRIQIHNRSISKLDVPPGSLDAVTGTDADGIHYVEDRQTMFDRVHDGLKDGGRFVFKAYVPSTRPEHMSEAAWKNLTTKFDASMGWTGEDASMNVLPKGINAEGYVEQLVQAGFKRDDIEVIDLNGMYTAWQYAVADNQAGRGFEDGWLKGWVEQNAESRGAFGFLIRAKKTPAED